MRGGSSLPELMARTAGRTVPRFGCISLTWAIGLVATSLVPSCLPRDPGDLVPTDELNLPVAVAISAGSNRLYVANSNFDLRFNSGSLLALDAEEIRARLPRACEQSSDCEGGRSCGVPSDLEAVQSGVRFCVDDEARACSDRPQTTAERVENPGICAPIVLAEPGIVRDAVRTTPFLADMRYALYGPADDRRARLFVTSRGGGTLIWADVENDLRDAPGPVLDCGQTTDARCDSVHAVGDEDSEQTRLGEVLPVEPNPLAVSTDGTTVAVGHETQGSVSLFTNDEDGVELESVLRGLSPNPASITAVPPPQAANVDESIDGAPAFLVSYRQVGVGSVDLLRVTGGDAPFFLRSDQAFNVSADTRAIELDDSRRQACELGCDGTSECLIECTATPLDVFAISRSPASLLAGQTRPALATVLSNDVPNFNHTVPLAVAGGPSGLAAGSIIAEDGSRSLRVFALAFNIGLLYVYDPALERLESTIQVGRGPQSIALDEEHGLLYVAQFTDSHISVVDFDRRRATYGQVLLSVGRPVRPISGG